MKIPRATSVIACAALIGVGILALRPSNNAGPLPRAESRADARTQMASILARLDRLEQQGRAPHETSTPRGSRTVRSAIAPSFAAPGADSSSAPETDSDSGSETDGDFRKRVEEAIRTNDRERTTQRVADVLKQLATDQRIGSLTSTQTSKISTRILAAREEAPELRDRIRKLIGDESLSTPERFELIRTEIDTFRDDVAADLEAYVPAADASVIADALLSGPPIPFGSRNR